VTSPVAVRHVLSALLSVPKVGRGDLPSLIANVFQERCRTSTLSATVRTVRLSSSRLLSLLAAVGFAVLRESRGRDVGLAPG
jgi:hypothetical protein